MGSLEPAASSVSQLRVVLSLVPALGNCRELGLDSLQQLPGALWKEERMWCAVRTGRCGDAGCQSRSSCPPLRRERGWKCSGFPEEKSCSISLLSSFSPSVLCGCRSTAVSRVVSCRLCSQPCEAWPWCSTARPQRPPATTGSCSTGSTSGAPGQSSRPAGKLECR